MMINYKIQADKKPYTKKETFLKTGLMFAYVN